MRLTCLKKIFFGLLIRKGCFHTACEYHVAFIFGFRLVFPNFRKCCVTDEMQIIKTNNNLKVIVWQSVADPLA